MQRFRGGLVFKAHRLSVSLNSRLESKEEETTKVSGLGYRVQGFGFRVSSLGSRVWGSEFGGLGFRVQRFGFRVWGLGSGVCGLGMRV